MTPIILLLATCVGEMGGKVSSFGEYEGYSAPAYDKWVLNSRYVEMRDGVRLAVDIVRPSADGEKPADLRFPVVWTHSRYHRNQKAMSPVLQSMVDGRPDLQRLVRHGYAVVTVGVRGSGASFGKFEGLLSPSETRDAYEIIDWISRQSWCDGNIGMFGGSYLGMTQYMAASTAHPALKAIFPNVAGFDLYDTIYPGGVFREDMIRHWDLLTTQLDTQLIAARVESDTNGALLKEAVAGHAQNWQVLNEYRKARFRDTVSASHSYSTHNPSPFLKKINQAKVPAYHWNGFYDLFVTDATLWYANYRGPQKLGIGPWPHSAYHDRRFMRERFRLQTVEQHRWFDYWLKGIDNGIMEEPPVHYSVLDEGKQWSWKSAKQWPPASSHTRSFYFAGRKSGSVKSVNDGSLVLKKPGTDVGADSYHVDPTTTTGTATRWDNAVGQGPMHYPDLTANDRKSLTYTTDPVANDVTITGHPVATLFITSSKQDCDFFMLLEEVDQQGESHYITEGVLRASQRSMKEPPWNNLGLPYQRCFKQDRTPLTPGEVVQLQLDLHPTSVVINKGHRLRVAIMCADKDNAEFLASSRGAEIQVLRNGHHASRIDLPVSAR